MLKLPKLTSSDVNLNSYCNFIEYTCFVDGVIEHSEFDLSPGGLNLKDILAELERRLRLYGGFIPYRLDKTEVTSLLTKKESNLHYFYCLYYAVKGGNSSAYNTNIFEKITDISLKNYFSTSTSKITSIGQNTGKLRKSINNFRISLNEVKGSMITLKPQAKDGGIDIITYKSIDNRGNQIICLTDATIGRNWKSQKNVTVKLDRWKEYIFFKVQPLTCLSIVHIVDDADFHNASKQNGLIFDRARIMTTFTEFKPLTTTLKKWIKTL